MRYTVTTFKVRLEVCEQGDRTAASDDVIRVARPIFAELDADKETLCSLGAQQQEPDQRVQSDLDGNADREPHSPRRRLSCGAASSRRRSSFRPQSSIR